MKIKIRVPSRTSLESVFYFLAMVCVVSFALLEHVSVPIPMFSNVKMPMMYLGGVCILTQIGRLIRVLVKKKYFYVMLVLLLLCGCLGLSAYFNASPSIGTSPMRNTVRLVLYLMELFFVMIWSVESGRTQFVLNFLFFYVLLLTVVTDFLMISRLIVFGSGGSEQYLVGTKFTVSYFHINLLTLWFIRNKQRLYSDRKAKRILLLGIPFLLWVSIHVDCMTGALGSAILLGMFALLNTQVRKRIVQLNSPVLLLTATTASVVFPFIAEQVISNPIVSSFITNVVGRSENLTGRINIFNSYINKMDGHWLWGYGFGNANAVAVKLFGYANAQNALLQWVLQVGIPTTAVLVLLMMLVFRQLTKSQAVVRSMPLVILIYLYIILGMIETTFSMSFLLWVGLVFMLASDNQGPQMLENRRDSKE